MITPIRFLLQIAKLIKYSNRRSSLNNPHVIGNRKLRWNHYHNMNMIPLNI